jgi:hypothetical protein
MEAVMRNSLILVALVVLTTPAYAQAPQSEFRSFGYARLGYGAVYARGFHPAPALGFGFRGETDSFALDVSGLNYLIGDSSGVNGFTFAGSLLKVQVLRMLNRDGDRSAYLGGGMSWGGVAVSRAQAINEYASGWYGTGLQGELAAGYELTRSSPLRTFVQADIGLPLFKSRSDVYIVTGRGGAGLRRVDPQYTPSVVVSLGVGWDRHRP